VAKKTKAGRRRQIIAVGIVVPSALAVGVVAANNAGAATTPLQVRLSACDTGGTGSSAVWNSAHDPVLTAGTAAAATCGAPAGSTYNPAYAEVDFTNAAGGAVPTTEPAFAASAYSSGTPRMVIELNNGNSLVGYPGLDLSGGTAPDAAGMAWAVGNAGTYTSYATAETGAGASTTTVKDAFIIEDGSQPSGTANTLTNVQYGGQTLGAGTVTVAPVAAQTVTIGTAATAVTVSASTTSSDNALTVAVTGLPDGLLYSASSGTITGTPAADAKSGTATVTATDAYGQTGTTEIVYTVNPAVVVPPPKPPVTIPVLSHGRAFWKGWTREIVTWQTTAPSWEKFVIIGPGKIDGHVGWVAPGTTIGYYSGLEAHHGYTVIYTPYTAKDGSPIKGAIPGKVYFVS
jgi:hypothetical protein